MVDPGFLTIVKIHAKIIFKTTGPILTTSKDFDIVVEWPN